MALKSCEGETMEIPEQCKRCFEFRGGVCNSEGEEAYNPTDPFDEVYFEEAAEGNCPDYRDPDELDRMAREMKAQELRTA